jgi:menaquinone-specific isochorismate synthase
VAWETPGGEARVGIGAIGAVAASGPNRFEEVRTRIQALIERCSFGEPFAFGGFAFASGRDSLFYLPELTFCRTPERDTVETRWTVTDAERATREAGPRSALPGLAYDDASAPDGATGGNRETWLDAVRLTLDRIRGGAFSKAVLARSVTVSLPRGRSSLDIFASLRESYPNCFRFLIDDGRGNAFLGASPERLVSHRGTIATEAVAGTMRCEPGDDEDEVARRLLESRKDRAEHDAVLRHLREALEPFCTKVDVGETEVMRLPHLLHLRTRIRAWDRPPAHVLDLASRLHPTPAVAGWPRAQALDWIARVEAEDRGWYAGPVGWLDVEGEGDFAVGIRSVTIRGDQARVFAGAGIVEGSDPEQEWNETELKMKGILDAIARD